MTARWFGGLTRNPWNTEQDAAGSSAGPGAATAAGLVGFSIGTDTGGSIIGPSTRNGVTGLRPTFGRVSRYGAMTLAWTQDTVGPMCRSAEDCALVFDAIYGPDGKDNTVLDVPFNWDASADVTKLRVGYLRRRSKVTSRTIESVRDTPDRRNNEDALRVIRSLGVTVVPFELPEVPIEAIDFIRYAETAAAFDDLTRKRRADRRSNRDRSRAGGPTRFAARYFIPAVEFIQANRFRMRVMEQVDEALGDLDLFIGSNQALTNRTGHPVVSVPNGFSEGSPTALHLTGKLFGEPEILLLAHAFQADDRFSSAASQVLAREEHRVPGHTATTSTFSNAEPAELAETKANHEKHEKHHEGHEKHEGHEGTRVRPGPLAGRPPAAPSGLSRAPRPAMAVSAFKSSSSSCLWCCRGFSCVS